MHNYKQIFKQALYAIACIFMFLGILFGSDGVLKISFDDYDLTAKLCSIGLLFIIFYGGFYTNLPETHLIALIKRGEKYFVPNGSTKIRLNDTIIFYSI